MRPPIGRAARSDADQHAFLVIRDDADGSEPLDQRWNVIVAEYPDEESSWSPKGAITEWGHLRRNDKHWKSCSSSGVLVGRGRAGTSLKGVRLRRCGGERRRIPAL